MGRPEEVPSKKKQLFSIFLDVSPCREHRLIPFASKSGWMRLYKWKKPAQLPRAYPCVWTLLSVFQWDWFHTHTHTEVVCPCSYTLSWTETTWKPFGVLWILKWTSPTFSALSTQWAEISHYTGDVLWVWLNLPLQPALYHQCSGPKAENNHP